MRTAASPSARGTQDIGTGTYTIFAQVVHEKTGIPLDRIDVMIGDSALARWAHVRRIDGDGICAECHRGGFDRAQ